MCCNAVAIACKALTRLVQPGPDVAHLLLERKSKVLRTHHWRRGIRPSVADVRDYNVPAEFSMQQMTGMKRSSAACRLKYKRKAPIGKVWYHGPVLSNQLPLAVYWLVLSIVHRPSSTTVHSTVKHPLPSLSSLILRALQWRPQYRLKF